jgi:glycosyltransferase involved in cell wall biosynthesis
MIKHNNDTYFKKQPIKVCFFSKYPPIEGGISSRTYWLSRALGKRGVEVHVITNALEVEEEYRETFDFEKPENKKDYQPKNVFVHSLNGRRYKYIPFSFAYNERLINLGIETIRKYNCNLIDSYYIQPYGVAAAFTKLLTSKPCILRHAASDIVSLLSNRYFCTLHEIVFQIADVIITTGRNNDIFEAHGVSEDKLCVNSFSSTDPEYFNPKIKPANLANFGVPLNLLKKPILTYIGKYNSHKSLPEIVKAAAGVKENFLLLFITGGEGLEKFKKYVQGFPSLKNKYYFLRFLPPWRIPSIIRASTCLLHLENDFPWKNITHTPTQPSEAFAVATPALISREVFNTYKRGRSNLEENRNILAVDPKNSLHFRKILSEIIKNSKKMKEIGRLGYEELFDKKQFEKGIENQILLYQRMIENSIKR